MGQGTSPRPWPCTASPPIADLGKEGGGEGEGRGKGKEGRRLGGEGRGEEGGGGEGGETWRLVISVLRCQAALAQ